MMKTEAIKKLKVATVFGTRPEIIRLSRIFEKLDRHFDHVMVNTSQNYDYELDEIFFEQMGIRKPDYSLKVKSDSLGGQIANIIAQSEGVFFKEKPDCILILGDTNSALSAIIAKRMRIPIFHMEAGNRCFDESVPEETNRKIIDHVSDINLAYSENARQYLAREGIKPETVYVTGSPLWEVFSHYKKQISESNILDRLDLKKGGYFVVSLHREENVGYAQALSKLVDTLDAVANAYKLPVIFGIHPRTKIRLKQEGLKLHPLVKPHKPFGYFDYVNLQKNSFCVLSDSGTILEECSMIEFPAVQLRTSSERPEAYDEGAAILSGLDKSMVLQSIEIITGQFAANENFKAPGCYRETNVSGKIVRLIASQAKNILRKYN
jgi:UDP-N-acetylglucosamine 2-epimerase (non-hydrolysing)